MGAVDYGWECCLRATDVGPRMGRGWSMFVRLIKILRREVICINIFTVHSRRFKRYLMIMI